MQQNNNQTPIQNQQAQAASLQTPANQPATKEKQLDKIKAKFNALPKNTRMMVMLAGILFLVLFILLLLSVLFGGKKQAKLPVLTPTPGPVSVTPGPNVIFGASRYATDSGVLKIESDLNGFAQQLNSTDVRQSDLTPPNIDFNINFNNQ